MRIVGSVLILVALLGTIGILEYDEVSSLLTHNQKIDLIKDLKEQGLQVALIDQTPNKISIISVSDQCEYNEFRIDKETGEAT